MRHGWRRDPIGFRRCWISRCRVGTCSRTHRCRFPAGCLAAVTANLGPDRSTRWVSNYRDGELVERMPWSNELRLRSRRRTSAAEYAERWYASAPEIHESGTSASSAAAAGSGNIVRSPEVSTKMTMVPVRPSRWTLGSTPPRPVHVRRPGLAGPHYGGEGLDEVR